MGLKNEVERFASSKGIALRDYQKSNIRNIERDYEAKKIDKNTAVSKLHQEFRKEGKILTSSEERELGSKII